MYVYPSPPFPLSLIHFSFISLSLSLPCSFFPTDLHAVIRAGILADIHKQYIIWQLLKALKYLHSAGNILVPASISILSLSRPDHVMFAFLHGCIHEEDLMMRTIGCNTAHLHGVDSLKDIWIVANLYRIEIVYSTACVILCVYSCLLLCVRMFYLREIIMLSWGTHIYRTVSMDLIAFYHPLRSISTCSVANWNCSLLCLSRII